MNTATPTRADLAMSVIAKWLRLIIHGFWFPSAAAAITGLASLLFCLLMAIAALALIPVAVVYIIGCYTCHGRICRHLDNKSKRAEQLADEDL